MTVLVNETTETPKLVEFYGTHAAELFRAAAEWMNDRGVIIVIGVTAGVRPDLGIAAVLSVTYVELPAVIDV